MTTNLPSMLQFSLFNVSAFNFEHHSFPLENIKNVFKDVQVEEKTKENEDVFFYKGIPFSLKLLVRKF